MLSVYSAFVLFTLTPWYVRICDAFVSSFLFTSGFLIISGDWGASSQQGKPIPSAKPSQMSGKAAPAPTRDAQRFSLRSFKIILIYGA